MAAEVSACLVSRGIIGFSGDNFDFSNRKPPNVRFSFLPSKRLLLASCKIRQRNLRSQAKKQVKKASLQRLPTTADQPNSDGNSEPGNSKPESISSLTNKFVHKDTVDNGVDAGQVVEENLSGVALPSAELDEQSIGRLVIPIAETSIKAERTNEQDLSTLAVPTMAQSLPPGP